VPRRQLAKLVPQIGNWEFASKAQFFLHDLGEITLGFFQIMPEGIYKTYDNDTEAWFPLPDVPIPENIKNFEGILIRRF
jgi:hypothetical protein